MAFKLTYATMFNPPEALHKGFDAAVLRLKQNLGQEYGMIIDTKDVFADEKLEDRSPVNTEWVLARMQKGTPSHAQQAVAAARRSFPAWSRTPWQERVRLVRKAASIIEQRIFDLGAAMALEVDKNRMDIPGGRAADSRSHVLLGIDDGAKQGLHSSPWARIRWWVMTQPTRLFFGRMASG